MNTKLFLPTKNQDLNKQTSELEDYISKELLRIKKTICDVFFVKNESEIMGKKDELTKQRETLFELSKRYYIIRDDHCIKKKKLLIKQYQVINPDATEDQPITVLK